MTANSKGLHYLAKHPIAYLSDMKHINVDAERLYECVCGEVYQVWANTEEDAKNIELGKIEVSCPYCLRSTTEAIAVCKHSGGFYNARWENGVS